MSREPSTRLHMESGGLLDRLVDEHPCRPHMSSVIATWVGVFWEPGESSVVRR